MVIVGIDASNIFTGGGLTHIREMINHADLNEFEFKVVIWSRKVTLDQLKDKKWLKKIHVPLLEKSLPYRQQWRNNKLGDLARKEGCQILFFPGGMYSGDFETFVTLCGNALPFSKIEKQRFGYSMMRLKMELTEYLQLKTMRRSAGTIYCSAFMKALIKKETNVNVPSVVAYVGINERFYNEVKPQKDISVYTQENPFKLLYVSSISAYKHQWILVEAVHRLVEEGYHLHLHLIGKSTFKRSLDQTRSAIHKFDPQGQFVTFSEYVEKFEDFINYYKNADSFLYSSSCENLPNILVEAMAAGLPIASSNYGPMPSVLKDAGIYYDPVSVDETYKAVKELIDNTSLRRECAEKAQQYTYKYRWEKVAATSFEFFKEIVNSKIAIES